MSKKFLLGYDVGTSGSKGVILDLSGKILASATTVHDVEYPRPNWAEQDADVVYWGEFQTICQKIVKDSNIDPADIAGIGISGLSPDSLPVDRDGNALRNCLLYCDRRALEECDWVEKNIGAEEVFRISGNQIDAYYAGYKCMWVARNEPEVYAKTFKFLNAPAYIQLKLTGQFVADHSTGGLYAPFYKLDEFRWDEDMIKKCGMDPDKFPKLYNATDVIGYVTSDAAEACGLVAGIPVVAGGGVDATASALCTGMIDSSVSTCMCGSTHCWQIVLDEPVFDRRFINLPYYVPGKWIALAGLGTSGSVVKWFRDNFAAPEKEYERLRGVSAYDLLNLEAEKTPKGSDGLITLPYFLGERSPIWDPRARGMFFGLSLYHNRGHMFRSIIEGIGFALEHHATILREKGAMPDRIIVCDGGAASNLERQAFADIMRVPVDYMSKIGGGPAADAFLAGMGVGIFKDFAEIRNWCHVDMTNEPDPSSFDTYKKLFDVYVNLYLNTKEEMHTVADMV